MDEQKDKRKEHSHKLLSCLAEQLGFTHRSRLPVHRWVLDRPSSRVPIPHYLQWVHTKVEC